jgi:hypothetical protein
MNRESSQPQHDGKEEDDDDDDKVLVESFFENLKAVA